MLKRTPKMVQEPKTIPIIFNIIKLFLGMILVFFLFGIAVYFSCVK